MAASRSEQSPTAQVSGSGSSKRVTTKVSAHPSPLNAARAASAAQKSYFMVFVLDRNRRSHRRNDGLLFTSTQMRNRRAM